MTGKQTLTEAQRQQKRESGRKGGLAKVKKGFAVLTPEKLREISSKGGSSVKKQTPKN